MDKNRYHKNMSTGKLVRNDIHQPCPNPECNLKRTFHTGAQAKECYAIAVRFAGN